MKKIKANIKGKVQGVGFRLFVKQQASKLSLKGYVKNLPDGSVEIVVHGDESIVNKLMNACKLGSLMSKVDSIDFVDDCSEESYDFFDLRY
ncbi:acylphosphatase [Candidatus Woesearchaeota archaeon]|nr:acylphosphatase [Candidatus Woesearchaeota archaeon]MBT6520392.1 acylphosphatase [Candidatus Woesearchaeota archaeon]